MAKARNYRREYDKYQGTEKQKTNRAARNKARRTMERKGAVHKGDGKDVDHKTPLAKGGGNGERNWRVKSKSANRSFKRTRSARMK
jgi:hypothetical protein